MTRPYQVESIEEVLRSDQFHIRRFTLAPGESIPWHLHPATRDDYYMLSGSLQIELRDPHEIVTLGAGETYRIECGRAHHNSNPGAEHCVFLLIQGPGPSTFTPS